MVPLGAGRDLAQALLPSLVARLGRPPEARAAACASACAGGWLLGVIADAEGADLLLARREPRGLAWTLEAVGELLAAEGRALDVQPAGARGDGGVPRLAPRARRPWMPCWALGTAVLLAGRGLAEGATLTARFEHRFEHSGARARLRLEPVAAGVAGAIAERLGARTPAIRVTARPPELALSFPSTWIARREDR